MFRYKQKGFSLIGVIATLFIVAIGLTGIIGLTSMSLKSATTSKMRLIASGLAQEGIEIVRDMRRANPDWDDWYSLLPSGDRCVQYDIEELIICSSDEQHLKIDGDGYYQHYIGDNSLFYRKVNFNKISNDELELTVEIRWEIRGNWSSLTIEDHLWNWK